FHKLNITNSQATFERPKQPNYCPFFIFSISPGGHQAQYGLGGTAARGSPALLGVGQHHPPLEIVNGGAHLQLEVHLRPAAETSAASAIVQHQTGDDALHVGAQFHVGFEVVCLGIVQRGQQRRAVVADVPLPVAGGGGAGPPAGKQQGAAGAGLGGDAVGPAAVAARPITGGGGDACGTDQRRGGIRHLWGTRRG